MSNFLDSETITPSYGGLVVKASTSQLGGRMFKSQTDRASWSATSYSSNSSDYLPTWRLTLGNVIWGNDLCRMICLIIRIQDDTMIKHTLLFMAPNECLYGEKSRIW